MEIERFVQKRTILPWYASINFGYGINAGRSGSPEGGQWKWGKHLRKFLNPVKGLRILDLGCNNESLGLCALREEAQEVVGFEKDSFYFSQAFFVQSVFEWLDMKKYNLTLFNKDFLDLLSLDLGFFDVILALDSLYYIDEKDLCTLLVHLKGITRKLIVQCNHSGQFSTPELNRKASVDYISKHLEQSGFTIEKIEYPLFYYRPIIVACANSSPTSMPAVPVTLN